MALMPLIQPPVMKLLTSKAEQEMGMVQLRKVSRLEKILFPIVIAAVVNLCFPPVAPLGAPEEEQPEEEVVVPEYDPASEEESEEE
jgi:hypothetical protein